MSLMIEEKQEEIEEKVVDKSKKFKFWIAPTNLTNILDALVADKDTSKKIK